MKPASAYIISLVYFLIFCGPAQPDVSIRVSPDRRQFFQLEHMSLSCVEERNAIDGWTVRRRGGGMTSNGTCVTDWGDPEGGESCTIPTPITWDSGVYWCESTSGDVSQSININIADGAVILQSPVLPVPEGGNATLRCLLKDRTTGQPSSDLPADFYQNGSLFSTESTGQMTILHINKSAEGFYKCSISGHGESPESWMEVAAESEPVITLTWLITRILVFTLHVISTFLYFSILKDRASARAANGRRRRDVNAVVMEVAV